MSFALVIALATLTSTQPPPLDPGWIAPTTTATTTVDTPDIPPAPPAGPGEVQAPPVLDLGDRGPVEPEGFEPGAPRIEFERPTPPATAALKTRKLPPEEHVWYGWLNLSIGLAGILTTMVAVVVDSVPLGYGGVMMYTFGPATAHWANGNFELGFASIGLNVGAPISAMFTLGMVGAAATERDNEIGSEFLVLGLLIGAVAAIAVDAVVLAYITEERPLLRPTVAVDSTSASFGIGGSF